MRLAPALLVLVLGLPAPGASQSPPMRVALAAFQDSLAREVDSSLITLKRGNTVTAAARKGDSLPELTLRSGLIALRLGELTGQLDHYEMALDAFEYNREIHPDWPWPWYGAALAHLGGVRLQSSVTEGVRAFFGAGDAERATRELVQSVTLDPSFVQGIARLAESAIARRNAIDGKSALDALRAVASQAAGRTPELLLSRARLEREFGMPALALEPLQRLLALRPGLAMALLELARSRFVLGQTDGTEPWFEGLATADGAVLAAYRSDISPLVPDSILAAFDRAAPADRVQLMRRYWADLEPDRLPATAERLRDHYIRLDYARRHYRLHRLADTRGIDPAVVGMGSELDDRGIIYVKHGPPDEWGEAKLAGVPPNETWSYHRPDATELIFHFALRDREGEFRRYSSLLDILARSNQFRAFADHEGRPADGDTLPRPLQTYGAELSAQLAQELMLSRWNVSPVYRQILAAGKGGTDSLQAEEREIGERAAASPGSFALRYELPLPSHIQVLAVGDRLSGGTVQAVYAVRAGDLVAHQTSRGFLYRLRLRAAVVNAAGDLVAAIDTTRDFVAAMLLAPDDALTGRFPIAVPPGSFTVRATLESDSHGTVTPRQRLEVPAPTGATLALSDLVLGAGSVRVAWQPQARDSVWVNPLQRFSAREPMKLYYEVSGLPAGADYSTTLSVFRISGDSTVSAAASDVVASGGTPALSISYEQRHPGGVAGVHRELSLARLKPGEYVLQIAATMEGRPRVVRRQAFAVAK